MTRLAALMLVGPGEADRHLERCIRSVRHWADMVVVYGDGPDSATRNLIGSFAHGARIADESVYEQGEHLARNRLLEVADWYLDPGDIVAVLDADEEFHGSRNAIRGMLWECQLSPHNAWSVHFLHLWRPDGSMHRVDGAWQPSIGPRIYRHQPGLRVEPYAGSWVCPPLPVHLMASADRTPVLDVLHWSYARPWDRAPKHERYSRLVGHSTAHVDSILTAPTLEPVP